jgi:hypothetical protein
LPAAKISVMPIRRAPLVAVAQGGFAATTAEVKRMLTARVQKLSAES